MILSSWPARNRLPHLYEAPGRDRHPGPERERRNPARLAIVSDAGDLEAAYRDDATRIRAALAARLGDVGLAEDCVQDAFVAALEHWPADGIPPNPGGWLATTARRKAIDRLRRERAGQEKLALLAAGQRSRDGTGAVRGARSGGRAAGRRRPARAHLRLLSSAAVAGVPDRADPAGGVQPDDRGDREGVPHHGADHGPAADQGQAGTARDRRASARTRARSARGPPGRGPRRHLPAVQRGLSRQRRADARPPRPGQPGDLADQAAASAHAQGAGSAGPAGAATAARVARGYQVRRLGAAGPAERRRTVPGGTGR